VHLLVLTERPGGGKSLLPALEYLDHSLQDAPLDSHSLLGMGSCDVVLVDGPSELRVVGSNGADSLTLDGRTGPHLITLIDPISHAADESVPGYVLNMFGAWMSPFAGASTEFDTDAGSC
jgi:hypothetical protein